MVEDPDPSWLTRTARWFQATPLELVGLLVLLAGALAVAVALWSTSVARTEQQPVGLEGPHVIDDAGDGAGPPTDPPPPAAEAPPADEAAPSAATEADELTVHVTGAVAEPGLVVVAAGARVGDAVAAVGGLEGDADPALINLARQLADGEHVHVPRVGEEVPAPPPAAGGAPDEATARVDLNTASPEQLETLPGIGPAKADAIVRHRETEGPFEVPGDLRGVPGIGEATFQQLADLVDVG